MDKQQLIFEEMAKQQLDADLDKDLSGEYTNMFTACLYNGFLMGLEAVQKADQK